MTGAEMSFATHIPASSPAIVGGSGGAVSLPLSPQFARRWVAASPGAYPR